MTMGADAVACAALAGGARREGVLRAQGGQGARPAAPHRGTAAGRARTAAWSSRTSSRPAARRSRRSRRCTRTGTHDLRRRQRARPARRRRRGDRARRGRALRGADDDRRHLPRAAGPRMSAASHGHAARRRRSVRRCGSARRRARTCRVLLEMFRELADYEQLRRPAARRRGAARRGRCSASRPRPSALIAERGEEAVGYARLLPHVLDVPRDPGRLARGPVRAPRASRRGRRAGRCSRRSPRTLRELGGERLEWAALDWNELALGFYRGIGAQHDGRVGHAPPRSARTSPAWRPRRRRGARAARR